MIGSLNLILRLAIWFLLTANLSLVNILLGLCIALLLPRARTAPSAIKDWLQTLGKILLAIPQAYFEAFEMILRPHDQEVIEVEQVKQRRSPGLVFLDIFLITFTPKTIVVKCDLEGGYEVHRVQRRRRT